MSSIFDITCHEEKDFPSFSTKYTFAASMNHQLYTSVMVSDEMMVKDDNIKQHVKSNVLNKMTAVFHDELSAAMDEFLEIQEASNKTAYAFKDFIDGFSDDEGNYVGAPGHTQHPVVEELGQYFPALYEEVENPVSHYKQPIADAVVYLNDHAGWSREQIADWLETLDVDITMQEEPEPVSGNPLPEKPFMGYKKPDDEWWQKYYMKSATVSSEAFNTLISKEEDDE